MTEQPIEVAKSPTGRWKFVALVVIATAPILFANLIFFYAPDWIPSGTTNEGNLISPPFSMSADLGTDGRWLMLIALPEDCAESCRTSLLETRQVHTSLGKNTDRIERRLLRQTPPDIEFRALVDEFHGGIEILVLPGLVRRLNDATQSGSNQMRVFIVDPNGNTILYYTPPKTGKPMLKDLKHLLKLSNIG